MYLEFLGNFIIYFTFPGMRNKSLSLSIRMCILIYEFLFLFSFSLQRIHKFVPGCYLENWKIL